MKRQQFLFRPNPHSDLHQRAWAYLQTCPAGQKNDYIAWAIICMTIWIGWNKPSADLSPG